MSYIPLTRGQRTIVDSADYDYLCQWKWHAHLNPHTGTFYAIRSLTIAPHQEVRIRMHRLILGLDVGDRRVGDHINGDTLDNRRENLRVATCAQNARNARLIKDTRSGVKGVTPRTKNGKPTGTFQAHICKNYHLIMLGTFATLEQAIAARKQAEVRLHGEYARRGPSVERGI